MLHASIEPMRRQHLVQAVIEDMPRRLDDRSRRKPELLLPLSVTSLAHSHATIYDPTPRLAALIKPDFYHGLLGGAGLLARRLDRERTVLDRLDAFMGAAFAGTPDPVTSLRTRLLPARSERTDPPDTAPATQPAPAQEQEFREELAAAVQALMDAVEEESSFVASLYGLD
ncbi:MAG TPA: hypothetical protein VLV83_07000, partial [Acidobacteriota bacterium]|nr:hypothetical protein [Acidobacteriota bacterium]